MILIPVTDVILGGLTVPAYEVEFLSPSGSIGSDNSEVLYDCETEIIISVLCHFEVSFLNWLSPEVVTWPIKNGHTLRKNVQGGDLYYLAFFLGARMMDIVSQRREKTM